jgi:predicted  nucleic acid-binding Zn ribbon protein
MYVQRIEFSFKDVSDDIPDLINGYLAALRMNGQIYGKEWPISYEGRYCVATLMTPEDSSLNQQYFNQYVNEYLKKLDNAGILVDVKNVLKSIEGESCCDCKNPSGFVLFTNFVRIGSPVLCMDCFYSVPLYKFPVMESGEYNEIIRWESDYQSCDSLQMNCTILEKSTIRQMSNLSSELNQNGRSVCQQLSGTVGKPFYYYLFRSGGKSLSQEKKRLCPCCGGDWLLDNPINEFFHFKCDKCRLLSNISWNFY